jgi:hypothetical protein
VILWHVDPFLDNDREISKYTTAITENGFAKKRVSTATIGYSNRGTVLSIRLVPRFCNQDGQLFRVNHSVELS